MQTDHQANGLAGGAEVGAVALGKCRIETRPIDLAGQLDQFVVRVEDLVKVGAKEFEDAARL